VAAHRAAGLAPRAVRGDGALLGVCRGYRLGLRVASSNTQTIPGTETQIALDRLLAALTAYDTAVLEWFATTTRGHQRLHGEPERYNATDALMVVEWQLGVW